MAASRRSRSRTATATRASAPGARSGGRKAATKGRRGTPSPAHYWSGAVTERSDALDLEPGVFKRGDARSIARSLKRSAEHSRRRKASAFQSAMSMLTFYINRAGKGLPAAQRSRLQAAKSELRALYGRPRR